MSKITNMAQLRARMLEAFEKLEAGEIDLAEAATLAKISETVISGLKSEMQYAILTRKEPDIGFYDKTCKKLLQHE